MCVRRQDECVCGRRSGASEWCVRGGIAGEAEERPYSLDVKSKKRGKK